MNEVVGELAITICTLIARRRDGTDLQCRRRCDLLAAPR